MSSPSNVTVSSTALSPALWTSADSLLAALDGQPGGSPGGKDAAALADVRSKLEMLRASLAQEKGQKDALVDQAERLQRELDTCRRVFLEQLEKARQDVADEHNANLQWSETCRKLKDTVQTLQNDKRNLILEAQTLRRQLAAESKRRATAQSEKQSLQERMAQRKRRQHEESLRAGRTAAPAAHPAQDRLRATVQDLRADLEQVTRQNKADSERLAAWEEELQARQSQLDAEMAELEDRQFQFEEARQFAEEDLRQRRSELDERKTQWETQMAELKSECRKLADRVSPDKAARRASSISQQAVGNGDLPSPVASPGFGAGAVGSPLRVETPPAPAPPSSLATARPKTPGTPGSETMSTAIQAKQELTKFMSDIKDYPTKFEEQSEAALRAWLDVEMETTKIFEDEYNKVKAENDALVHRLSQMETERLQLLTAKRTALSDARKLRDAAERHKAASQDWDKERKHYEQELEKLRRRLTLQQKESKTLKRAVKQQQQQQQAAQPGAGDSSGLGLGSGAAHVLTLELQDVRTQLSSERAANAELRRQATRWQATLQAEADRMLQLKTDKATLYEQLANSEERVRELQVAQEHIAAQSQARMVAWEEWVEREVQALSLPLQQLTTRCSQLEATKTVMNTRTETLARLVAVCENENEMLVVLLSNLDEQGVAGDGKADLDSSTVSNVGSVRAEAKTFAQRHGSMKEVLREQLASQDAELEKQSGALAASEPAVDTAMATLDQYVRSLRSRLSQLSPAHFPSATKVLRK